MRAEVKCRRMSCPAHDPLHLRCECTSCSSQVAFAVCVFCLCAFAYFAVGARLCAAETAPDKTDIVGQYISMRVALDDAIEAKQWKRADRLEAQLKALAKRLASARGEVFRSFVKKFEKLHWSERHGLLMDDYWPFRTKESYEYLLDRYKKDIEGDSGCIATLLAARRYKRIVPLLKETYRKRKAKGPVSPTDGIALIALGELEPVLDMVAVVEEHNGRKSEEMASVLAGSRGLVEVIEGCAGPLAELYLVTDKDSRDREGQAISLALKFGLPYTERKGADEAERLVDAWLKTKPSRDARYYSYRFLADLGLRYKQVERALGYFDKALEMKPKDVQARFGRAKCLDDLGKRKQAIGVLEELVKEDPLSFQGWYVLAIVHHRAGKYKDAAKAYEKALKITPGHRDALRYLRTVYLKLDQKEKAKALEERLKKLTTKPATTRSAEQEKKKRRPQ